MKIHEYQGKEIVHAYNVPVPRGNVASSPQEARQVAETLGGSRWVVKAQIHAGGRGKGGGEFWPEDQPDRRREGSHSVDGAVTVPLRANEAGISSIPASTAHMIPV